ncbi:IS3 family transposase [Listeria booriae]
MAHFLSPSATRVPSGFSYYNKNRIQQKLDYRSPIEYRQAAV